MRINVPTNRHRVKTNERDTYTGKQNATKENSMNVELEKLQTFL